jgi:hypothetical protein
MPVVAQFESALKGHGFSRAVTAAKINSGFSRCGNASFKLIHYPHAGLDSPFPLDHLQ